MMNEIKENKTKILMVEDHKLMRVGLKAIFEDYDDLEIIAEADNGIDAVKLSKELKPDVILMDIGLPEIDGIEATKRIRELHLDCKILMFTSRESEDDVFAAILSVSLISCASDKSGNDSKKKTKDLTFLQNLLS